MSANMRNMVTVSKRRIVMTIIQLKFAKNQSAMWQNVQKDILSHAGILKQEAVGSKNSVSMIIKNKLIQRNFWRR